MIEREDTIERIERVLKLTRKNSITVTIPRLTAEHAVSMLKKQEPIEPIYNEEKYGDHLPHCGNCEKVLPNNAVYGKVNFCHYCGRAVK